MAYEGWVKFGDVELFNVSRTAQLAQALGIDIVRIRASSVQWIQDEVGGGADYSDITEAPWYDAGFPASSEFAGIVPLDFDGLDASTTEATPVEYLTDGGSPGRSRNATLPIVASVVIVASTPAGADYGYRWMNRVLKNGPGPGKCSGKDLDFFRYPGVDAPIAHYRDVKLTRGSSITRKRHGRCASSWGVTFTLTAGDPYQYGEGEIVLQGLGADVFGGFGTTPFGEDAFGGSQIISNGSLVLTQTECPNYDYTPIFDPLYPALVPSPTVPNLYPDGWDVVPGATFERYWARLETVEPALLNVVPTIMLTAAEDTRMIRVGIWPEESANDDQCDPLFLAVISYLPSGAGFYIDGEQKAAYVWDGASPVVRRTDSLVYGVGATPVQWTAFEGAGNLLVTLDLFSEGSGFAGDGTVRMDLTLTPKSD